MTEQDRRSVETLTDLVPVVQRAEGFSEILAALRSGKTAGIDGAWGSACALSAAGLARECPATLLIVLPRISDLDDFALDVAGFSGEAPLIFPAWETLPDEHHVSDSVFGGRLRVLAALEESPPPVIVTCIAALLQQVPSRAERRAGRRTLRVGEELEVDGFLQWLIDRGFDRVPAIEAPGEFSMHGGIIDLFPPEAEDPVRVELFGDEIESIRRFDVETQRTIEELDSATFTLVSPAAGLAQSNGAGKNGGKGDAPVPDDGESLLDSLSGESWVALTELQELVDEGKHYLARLADPRGLYTVPAVLSRCGEFPLVSIAGIAADGAETLCHLNVQSIERFVGPRTEALVELGSALADDERALIACHNPGERERLRELISEVDLPLGEGVTLCLGRVARGFRLVSEKLVVVGDDELFNRHDLQRKPPRRRGRMETRAIDSFLELRQGDLVVHLTHGIGRFRGMKLIESDGRAEEQLVIEFRDAIKVYVPVSLIHLVQKYVGAAKSSPRLSKVGGKLWSRKKQRVADAVSDMAADMLRLQAARNAKPGIAAPPDSHWQHEFETSFPYTETEDQLRAISEMKGDMEQSRPMDRLICGDVGYGKTEVAMRGAFKAIEAGRQVAVLVPTTVLAEQHFRTFCERMAEYPVTIEVLSRFRSRGEQNRIIKAMAAGGVDLVIGTHRLVQKDVQFKDLGLLVIDEEQRFGVEAKEMLKRMRLEVDVLTLSATPIPRTLHMSLLGIRDISNLVTPPRDRQAIETRVTRFSHDLIRTAIIRELNRNGQVYFVHNRVHNIHEIAETIHEIVPEATIGIGHGQMSGDELEQTMFDFVSGRTDVLVCTTIIESGVDIPNANTMFIHRADQFGLADLHQLRGRVGRHKHRAYCYLLLEEGRPLTSTAAKRMKAIEEFSELGAGFKIAMRDLEIRGAGNILGTEQSGHISSVGYELYCHLLENAVRRLKNEPLREHQHVAVHLPLSAYIPPDYVPPGRMKIDLYRKLSLTGSFEELDDFAGELRDRFGPPPEPVQRLLRLRELQIAAWHWRIDDIHLEDRFAVFGYREEDRIRGLRERVGSRLRIVDARKAYYLLEDAQAAGDELIAELKTVLRTDG